MGVVGKSDRQLLLWLWEDVLTLKINLMIYVFNPFYMYIFIFILFDWKKLKNELKIKVLLHKMFCEPIFLSADLERE